MEGLFWAGVLVLVAFSVFGWRWHSSEVKRGSEMDQNAERHRAYLQVLIQLIKIYKLDTLNPYVYAPAFEEDRCWFCMMPKERKHGVGCPWVTVYPILTEVMGGERQDNVDTSGLVTEAGGAVGVGDEGCHSGD